jgi:nucleoside-diphosphate-sugar epimerase
MDLDPDLDWHYARLGEPARRTLLSDSRRIAIVGARGWIGRTLLALLREALGAEEFARRVVCFGSTAGTVDLEKAALVQQRPLGDLAALPTAPTMLFHLAFLTKDKVASLEAEAYVTANRALSSKVHDALEVIGVDRLFVASSGAAAFADDPNAAADIRLYGGLKREDEERFAAWALGARALRRSVIARIYSVSGPWMNKHETYALANFLLDALAHRPIEVRSPRRILRSYVAVRELLSVVIAALLAPEGEPVLRFETGGETLELGEVAAAVARVVGGEVSPRRISERDENRYVGDAAAWAELLARFGQPHVPFVQQVAETATWMARQTEPGIAKRAG